MHAQGLEAVEKIFLVPLLLYCSKKSSSTIFYSVLTGVGIGGFEYDKSYTLQKRQFLVLFCLCLHEVFFSAFPLIDNVCFGLVLFFF